MTPEQIFDNYKYVVKLTVDRMYKNEHQAASVAKNYGLDYQDLLQIGYMELWHMALKHDTKHLNFFGYATTAIRFSLIEATARKGSLVKLPVKGRQEIRDRLVFDNVEDRDDLLPDSQNVERYVINKLILEERLSLIKNPINVTIVKLSAVGYSDKEIAAITGFSHQSILARRNRAIKKMAG